MIRLIDREFVVNADVEHAWKHLDDIENWPSWAMHIKKIILEPAGTRTQNSSGTIHLKNGIKSQFAITAL